MKRFLSEWCAGAMRWATIGVVTGAAALAGCRGAESASSALRGDTTTRICTVQGLIVTPNAASLTVGQTTQLAAAQPCATNRPSVFIFASSASSVASVDRHSGVVTGISAGNAIITVTDSTNPGAQGTSAITVAPVPMGLTIATITDAAGHPAKLDSVAGMIAVTLNVVTGPTTPVSDIALILNWGSGDVVVGSVQPNVAIAGAPITMFVNTAARDSTGALQYPNGACTLKARLTSTSGQVFWGQNTVSLVLRN